jgi:hypothetical protein
MEREGLEPSGSPCGISNLLILQKFRSPHIPWNPRISHQIRHQESLAVSRDSGPLRAVTGHQTIPFSGPFRHAVLQTALAHRGSVETRRIMSVPGGRTLSNPARLSSVAPHWRGLGVGTSSGGASECRAGSDLINGSLAASDRRARLSSPAATRRSRML